NYTQLSSISPQSSLYSDYTPDFHLALHSFPTHALPIFNIERQLGLFDTWAGLIIPYITFALPLAIYTLSAFFREIPTACRSPARSEEHTSELQSRENLVCRLLLEKKKK